MESLSYICREKKNKMKKMQEKIDATLLLGSGN
jgi:hypothetical protein